MRGCGVVARTVANVIKSTEEAKKTDTTDDAHYCVISLSMNYEDYYRRNYMRGVGMRAGD